MGGRNKNRWVVPVWARTRRRDDVGEDNPLAAVVSKYRWESVGLAEQHADWGDPVVHTCFALPTLAHTADTAAEVLNVEHFGEVRQPVCFLDERASALLPVQH